jgi:hypothetical protein
MFSEPKQHHYIPKCYSKNFANADGLLMISDLWREGAKFASRPEKAFRANYMYSQPVYAENRFDNSIEHFFSKGVETNWTPIVENLVERMPIDLIDWDYIVQFICSMFVRVPLTFDAIVELLQENIGRNIPNDIPTLPEEMVAFYKAQTGFKDADKVGLKDLIASEIVAINVDPHRAIASLGMIVANIPTFQPGIKFGVPKILHNKTNLSFLSSDNPVCFYGNQREAKNITPYQVQKGKPFSFVFPLSSSLALVNSSFLRNPNTHIDIDDRSVVADINRTIAKFSYRYVFGNTNGLLAVGQKYQNVCPRPDFNKSIIGNGFVEKIAYKFGRPKRIENSWTYDIAR